MCVSPVRVQLELNKTFGVQKKLKKIGKQRALIKAESPNRVIRRQVGLKPDERDQTSHGQTSKFQDEQSC